MIGPVEKALLALMLLVLMTGMGATLRLADFKAILKQPKGVLIGLASQFGWMPLLAFGLSFALDLPASMAIGLIIVGCTPGGTTSNLFTYYAGADVALSISMTVVSTLVAVVLMPALLWAYTRGITEQALDLPLGSIVTTLLLVLVPVAIGIAVRAKRPKVAGKLERAGSYSGILVLILLVGSSLIRNHATLAAIPANGYLAAAALGAVGLGLGWLAAFVLRLGVPQRRAVALETGIQNSPLAFAVIIASFPAAAQDELLWLPMLYALFVLTSASLATMLFRWRGPVPHANRRPA